MLGFLKQKLLDAVQQKLGDEDCPSCGKKFRPFAGEKLTAWDQRTNCPHCGQSVSLQSVLKAGEEEDANLRGPFSRPEESRIERSELADGSVFFHIPAPGPGNVGCLLGFALFWNVFSGFYLVMLILHRSPAADGQPWWLVAIFPLAGVGLLYAALRGAYASHLLYLGPELVRMQRKFLWRKNHDLPTAAIETVRKSVFYTQNKRPVHGIEIAGRGRSIRFGSALFDEEQDWICWEIRQFLREKAGVAIAELGRAPVAEDEAEIDSDEPEAELGDPEKERGKE
jgi:hypothetical protein